MKKIIIMLFVLGIYTTVNAQQDSISQLDLQIYGVMNQINGIDNQIAKLEENKALLNYKKDSLEKIQLKKNLKVDEVIVTLNDNCHTAQVTIDFNEKLTYVEAVVYNLYLGDGHKENKISRKIQYKRGDSIKLIGEESYIEFNTPNNKPLHSIAEYRY